MANYNIKDFIIGESVFHLSNASLSMIVIEINIDSQELVCRWMDNKGNLKNEKFIPQELGKTKDLGPGIWVF